MGTGLQFFDLFYKYFRELKTSEIRGVDIICVQKHCLKGQIGQRQATQVRIDTEGTFGENFVSTTTLRLVFWDLKSSLPLPQVTIQFVLTTFILKNLKETPI